MSRTEANTSEIFQGNPGVDSGSDQKPAQEQSLAKMQDQLAELNRQLNSTIFDKKDQLPHLEALYQRTAERRDVLQAQVTEIEDRPRLEAERIKREKNQEIAQAIRTKVQKDTQYTVRLKNTPEPVPYKSSEDRNFIEAELQKIDDIIALYTDIIIERKSLTTDSAKEMEQKIRSYEQTRQAYYEDLIALEEKEMIVDIKSEISHLLGTGNRVAELQRIFLTDETITDLVARGYRPGAGEGNLEILLPIIQGKLSAAEEILQHYFPDLQIDEFGEPMINWWGRLWGKDKKIKNHEDYQIFRAIFDLKTHLEAEPAAILPEPEPAAIKAPAKSKRSSPILKYATMAATGAAVMSDQIPNPEAQPKAAEEIPTVAQREFETEDERPAGLSEINIAPTAKQIGLENKEQSQDRRGLQLASQTAEITSAYSRRDLDTSVDVKPKTITKKPAPEKNPLKNTLVGILQDSKFRNEEKIIGQITSDPKINSRIQAQIDSAFTGSEDYEPDLNKDGSVFEQGPAKPSMETHLARVTETPKKKLSTEAEKMIATATPKVSKKTQTALAGAFTGGQKFEQETADEKRFRFEPTVPDKDGINLSPNRRSDAFEEESDQETNPKTLEVYRDALTPAVYDSLFRRLQKLGFSTPEQSKILDHMVKITDSMPTELKAKKISQALKLDHKGFKRTFKQAFLE